MAPAFVFPLSALSAVLYAVAIAIFANLHRRAPRIGWVGEPVSNYAVGSANGYFCVHGYAGTVAAALLAIQFAMSTAPDIPRVSVVCRFSQSFLNRRRAGAYGQAGRSGIVQGRLHLLFALANFVASYTTIANATPVMAASAAAWLAATLSGIRSWPCMLWWVTSV